MKKQFKKAIYFIVLIILLAGCSIFCIRNIPQSESLYPVFVISLLLMPFTPVVACLSGVYIKITHMQFNKEFCIFTFSTPLIYFIFSAFTVSIIQNNGFSSEKLPQNFKIALLLTTEEFFIQAAASLLVFFIRYQMERISCKQK